jgi:methyltransferase OMS1
LEIATGTGRNLHLYPKTLDSISFIDSSSHMIQLAWQKYLKLTRNDTLHASIPKSTFHVMDASQLAFQNESFDTIVDTFGLCSCEDPYKVVQEMRRVCKKGGTLLFLEHGRTRSTLFTFLTQFMNDLLDKGALDHAQKWGCWWNRDILEIVQSCGLDILEQKQYHLGTTYFIVAKKPN